MHVFPSFNPGGAELRVIRIMNALGARAKHTVLALNGKLGARRHIDSSAPVDFVEPPPRYGSGIAQCQVVHLANWTDASLTGLAPHEPAPTGQEVAL